MAGAWLPAVDPPVHCPGLPLYSQAVFPSPARLACLALLLVRVASAADGVSAPAPRAVPEDASLRLSYGVAFLRGDDVLVAVSRWTVKLAEIGWGDTTVTLPEGIWTDRLSGRTHAGTPAAIELFAELPVVLLERTDV